MYENLKSLRESLHMKQDEFGATVGIKKTTYQGYEAGAREPGADFWIAVADKYKVTLDFLLDFWDDPHGSKYGGRSELEEKYYSLDDHGRAIVDLVLNFERERIAEDEIIDLGTIRKYLSSPAAGVGGMIEGEDYEDIPRTPEMPKDADFCLTVSGDSMEPFIQDGELVFVKETAPLTEFDVGVWCVDGATYIKQYAPMYGGGLMLLSANPEREDANIRISPNGNQSVQYFGKVILKRKLPRPMYK